MGTRRTSTSLLVAGACFVAAVAAAANVQPLDIEWKVGLTESSCATLLPHFWAYLSVKSSTRYLVRDNQQREQHASTELPVRQYVECLRSFVLLRGRMPSA